MDCLVTYRGALLRLFVGKVGCTAQQEAHNGLVTLAGCTVQDGQLVFILKTKGVNLTRLYL